MFKLKLKNFIVLLSCLTATFCFAQTNSTSTTSSTNKNKPQTPPVSSPTDFISGVHAKDASNQNSLSQKMNNQIANQPPNPISPLPKLGGGSSANSGASPQNVKSLSTPTPPASSPTTSGPTTTPEASGTEAQPVQNQATSTPAPTSTSQPITIAPTSPPQTQVYTGFQSPTTNSGSSGSSSQSQSGGWNIKY